MEWKPSLQGTYGPNINAFKNLNMTQSDADDRGDYNSFTVHRTDQLKVNSKSLEYEDVFIFTSRPTPIACTKRSVIMEWKQTLQGYSWKMNAFWWLTDVI